MPDLSTEIAGVALAAIRGTRDPDRSFYQALLDWCMNLTGADEGGILSVAHNGESMRLECWRGQGVDVKSRILPITQPPTSICAECVLLGQPRNIPDVHANPLFLSLSDSPIRSQLAVPVAHADKVIGVINVESKSAAFFNDQHKNPLITLASIVGPIWNLVETHVREARRRDLSESLRHVSKSLLTDSPEAAQNTLELILNEALRLTNSEVGGVCLLSPEKDVLVVGPAKHLKPMETAPTVPRGTGFTWMSLRERKAQNIPDVRKHPDIYRGLSDVPIRSLLCAPMLVDSDPVGVLNVESTELNHFSLLDEEILTAFALEAAIAVRLIAMRKRFAAADSLAALGFLSGNLTHRINNSVGGIRVLSKMLARRLDTSPPDVVAIVDEIHDAATETLNVIEHYEDMFDPSEKAFNIEAAAKKVVDQMRFPDGISISVELNAPHSLVYTSEGAVSEIVRELLRNSVKSLGSRGAITIRTAVSDSHIQLSVSDNGAPIPSDKVSKIFERGNTSRPGGVGSGFGLWWIRMFMQKLGGHIQYNEDSFGNTFRLSFPKFRAADNTD